MSVVIDSAPGRQSPARSLPLWLDRQAIARGDGVALRHKLRGRWVSWTWRALAAEVAALSAGLAQLGFARGDALALLGSADHTSPRQLIAVLAAQALGGVALPIEAALAADSLGAVLSAAEARFAFASDQTQVDRLFTRRGPGPAIRLAAVVFDDGRGMRGHDHDHDHDHGPGPLHAYEWVRDAGRAHPRATEAAGDCAAFAFWSIDLAGQPRSSSLTHGQLREGVAAAARHQPLSSTDETLALYPLTSPAGAAVMAAWLAAGFPYSCPEREGNPDTDRREIRPTFLFAPADWYERVWREVDARLPAPRTRQRRLLLAALRVSGRAAVPPGRRGQALDEAGREPTVPFSKPLGDLVTRLARLLVRLLVVRPLASTLGLGRVRLAAAIGHPAADEAQSLFSALGIPIAQIALSADHAPRLAAPPPPDGPHLEQRHLRTQS